MTADHDLAKTASREPASPVRSRRFGKIALTGTVFGLLTLSLVIAAYRFGEGVVYIDGRTISDLSLMEVTGGAAAGAVGLVVGLGAALLALAAAVLATGLSLILATLGVGLGIFVTIGVVSGPILLAIIIGVLIKRRYYPDVI